MRIPRPVSDETGQAYAAALSPRRITSTLRWRSGQFHGDPTCHPRPGMGDYVAQTS